MRAFKLISHGNDTINLRQLQAAFGSDHNSEGDAKIDEFCQQMMKSLDSDHDSKISYEDFKGYFNNVINNIRSNDQQE